MKVLQNLLLLSRRACCAASPSGWSSIPTASSTTLLVGPPSTRPIVVSRRQQTRYASSSSSNDFTPSPPPPTHGTPVFPNVSSSEANYSADAIRRNADKEAVFVVTGASRGIGKQLVHTLLERTKGRIIACCRNPNDADLPDDPRIHRLALDLAKPDSIATVGTTLREEFQRVDMLWNVAGILGPEGKPERSLSQVTAESCTTTFAVNFLGPLLLTKEILPLVQQRHRQKTDTSAPLVVANLSARVGSISDNGLGGWYSYRTSKSALNQATRTMALELKRYGGATAIALHPGTTDTDLSRPFHKNVKEGSLFPVEFTVEQLLNVVDTMDPKVHGGGFYDWAGKAISF